jgi:hypothetical protein
VHPSRGWVTGRTRAFWGVSSLRARGDAADAIREDE